MTDPETRRGAALLGASLALAWAGITMLAGPGPAAFVLLSGRLSDAGLYFALWSLSGAAGAFVAGRAMDRFGRRPVLVAAHLASAAGYGLAGLAVATSDLRLFATGVAVVAFAVGGVYLTRVAAADLFPPAERGRGVARVQVAAVAGAIAGPVLLVVSGPLGAALGRSPLTLVWFLAPPLALVAALLVARAPEPRDVARRLAIGSAVAPDGPIAARPLAAAVVALALTQAAMVAVMGVAGAAMSHEGHGVPALGAVMAAHFLGMFAFSLVVGRLADRFGRRRTILGGLVVLAAGGGVVALVPGAAGFAFGLFLVGLGWSFAYVAATVLIADVVPLARRARVTGLADVATALVAAVVTASAGLWYASRGLPGLGLVAVALAALPAVLLLPLREPRPGSYATAPPAPG